MGLAWSAPQLQPALVVGSGLGAAFTMGVTWAATDTNMFGFSATAQMEVSMYHATVSYTPTGATTGTSVVCSETWFQSTGITASTYNTMVPVTLLTTITETVSAISSNTAEPSSTLVSLVDRAPAPSSSPTVVTITTSIVTSTGAVATTTQFLMATATFTGSVLCPVANTDIGDGIMVISWGTGGSPTHSTSALHVGALTATSVATITPTSTLAAPTVPETTATVTTYTSTDVETSTVTVSVSGSTVYESCGTSSSSVPTSSSSTSGSTTASRLGCGILQNRAALAADERAKIEARVQTLIITSTTESSTTASATSSTLPSFPTSIDGYGPLTLASPVSVITASTVTASANGTVTVGTTTVTVGGGVYTSFTAAVVTVTQVNDITIPCYESSSTSASFSLTTSDASAITSATEVSTATTQNADTTVVEALPTDG
ncbi:hypothetical protein BX600DRAFT_499467 [Xylariales sp. PMI_506]|nr:hypothetical protein BX600DRAFT_499467 [Xylariales sp. PMI_506]